jgi:hypothetical protein
MAQVIQAGPAGLGGGRGANLDQEVQGYLEQLNGLFSNDPALKHRFPIEARAHTEAAGKKGKAHKHGRLTSCLSLSLSVCVCVFDALSLFRSLTRSLTHSLCAVVGGAAGRDGGRGDLGQADQPDQARHDQ